jgi:hypothetical protein
MVQAERHIRQISLRGAELEPDVAGTLFRVRSSYDDLSWSTVLVAGWGRRLWSEGCGAKVVERRLWSEGCGAKVVERNMPGEKYLPCPSCQEEQHSTQQEDLRSA